MSSPDELLKRYAQETAPAPEGQRRLAQRLALSTDPKATRALLAHLPGPSDFGIARVLARVRASIRLGERVAMPVGTGPLIAAGAAAAVVAVGLISAPSLVQQSPPVMIAATLESAEAATSSPAPGVQFEYSGWGFLSGSETQPRVQWAAGALHVEVEPDAGIDLRIETPHGEVSVIGTVFDVDVSDLGTRVAVQRGEVRVACELGETSLLTAGQSATCVRASSANLLNFAVQARTRGGTPDQVLSLAEQGLGLEPGGGLIRDELRLVRFQSLLKLKREAEARSAADDYLSNPAAPRHVEVLRTTAKLAFAEGSCPLAVPYLSVLSDSLGAKADDLVPLARCLGRAAPDKALALLDRADAMQPEPQLAATIATLRTAIATPR